MNKSKEKAQSGLLEQLKLAQNQFGYLSEKVMAQIAKSLNIPLSEVYGVASFYSFLATEAQGSHTIRVCKSLPCLLKNAQIITNTIQEAIGIKPGETTPDGKFSLQLSNCIGACDKAPAMMIDKDVHTDLTPSKIHQILKAYR